MDEYTAEELRQARAALSDADKLRETNATDEAIVNRLYYACFHAASAALHERGSDPTTHRGVISTFGEEVVLEGDASRDAGRFLNRMRNERMTADYEHTPITADVEILRERTGEFVAEMEDIV